MLDLGYVASPTTALSLLKEYLRDGGAIVAVAPNSTFAEGALALLAGDDPHCSAESAEPRLRRYTRKSLEQLLDESELILGCLNRHNRPPVTPAELEDGTSQVSPHLLRALLDDGDARTEEFVVRARLLPVPGLRWVQGLVHEAVEARAAAESEIEVLNARLQEQENHLQAISETAQSAIKGQAEWCEQLLDAHNQLLLRDEELMRALAREVEMAQVTAHLQERTEWVASLNSELAEKNSLIAQLQTLVVERTSWAQSVDDELIRLRVLFGKVPAAAAQAGRSAQHSSPITRARVWFSRCLAAAK